MLGSDCHIVSVNQWPSGGIPQNRLDLIAAQTLDGACILHVIPGQPLTQTDAAGIHHFDRSAAQETTRHRRHTGNKQAAAPGQRTRRTGIHDNLALGLHGRDPRFALLLRIALRAKQKSFCDHCVKQEIVTCERGNQHGWACPYGLAVHEIEDNAECGLCMECLRSCHYTNISIYWRRFGPDRLLRGPGEALQASVMLTLAVAYAILFQGPWHQLRDMVDLVDKKNWDLFAYYAVALWLLALVLVPFTIRGLAALGGRIAAARDPLRILYPRTASTLVPMGLFLWIAFAIPMLQIQGSFVLSTLSDPFGWGWDLFGTAGYPWTQLWPESIPWIQSAMVLLGFAFALSTAFRAWSACVPSQRQALLGLLPIGAFLFLLSAGMLWFFTA